MYINTDHIELLIQYGQLDEEGAHGEAETADVHLLLDALKEDATLRAITLYEHVLKTTHPSLYPFSAVRPLPFPELTDKATDFEREIVKAPPALLLALGRKTYLPKDKPGDEVDLDTPGFSGLRKALLEWNPGEIRRWVSESGWVKRAYVIFPQPAPPKLSQPPKPKPPGPVVETPEPEPEPEPELDFDLDEPDPNPDDIDDLPPEEPPQDSSDSLDDTPLTEPPGEGPSDSQPPQEPAPGPGPSTMNWRQTALQTAGVAVAGVIAWFAFSEE